MTLQFPLLGVFWCPAFPWDRTSRQRLAGDIDSGISGSRMTPSGFRSVAPKIDFCFPIKETEIDDEGWPDNYAFIFCPFGRVSQ